MVPSSIASHVVNDNDIHTTNLLALLFLGPHLFWFPSWGKTFNKAIEWVITESNWNSRFLWEFGEIRASSLHVRILPFLCLLSAVEYQGGIPAKLLQQRRRHSSVVHHTKQKLKLALASYTWRPAWPSSAALSADFSTRMAMGLFLKICLHHLTVSCSSWASCMYRSRVLVSASAGSKQFVFR